MRVIKGNTKQFLPASHEDPRYPGVVKKILLARADIPEGRVQMLNWARLPAGKSFAAHYHQDLTEIFVMIAGVADISVGTGHAKLRSGDAVVIDPKETHTMHNYGSSDVEYLVIGITTDQGGKTIVV